VAIYRPSELLRFLKSLGRDPKKSLSQNFLIDGNVIKNIVRFSDIQPEDCVLEIGSGPGALTEALLQSGAYVVAIELDPVLASALERFQSDHLQVITGDALHVPLSTLFAAFPPHKKITVMGNLPYHIATPLLSRFITERGRIHKIIVMVQEEMARRMTAEAKTPDYSSLTLYLNFYADVAYAFKVSRNCFYPVPKVDSAIVQLTLKPPQEGIDETQFFTLTRAAFEQRRKTLRASLKELFTPKIIEQALEQIDLPPLSRPEELSFDDWLMLYRTLHHQL
jgi:16S rRNA (adenine1518-N6/adenine1519-N6)-dimethyltransferase